MRVDFYQLSRDPVEHVAALLAQKALASGARVLAVTEDNDLRNAVSQALWSQENTFLAHGDSNSPDAGRHPILLSDRCETTNGATMVLVLDGAWTDEATAFERAFLLFGDERAPDARALWARLSGSGHDLRIFKQRADGGWREGR